MALRISASASSPPSVRDAVARARGAWLRTCDVMDLLTQPAGGPDGGGVHVSTAPPDTPPSGALFVFDRRTTRHFRRDGHAWRTKADGRTVRETHEKLKAGARRVLACFYAHSAAGDGMQRRCYWLLDNDQGLVLVHYLAVAPPPRSRGPPPRGAAAALARAASAPAGAAAAAPPPPTPLPPAHGLPHGVTHQPGPNGVTVTTGSTGAARRRGAAGGAGSGGESDGSGDRDRAAAGAGAAAGPRPSPFASTDLPPLDAAPPSPPRPPAAIALARAATAPATWRALAASAGRVPSGTLGPLHAAPSWDGPTVSTGETLDAAAAAELATAEAAAAAAPPPAPRAPPSAAAAAAVPLSAASAAALAAVLAGAGLGRAGSGRGGAQCGTEGGGPSPSSAAVGAKRKLAAVCE